MKNTRDTSIKNILKSILPVSLILNVVLIVVMGLAVDRKPNDNKGVRLEQLDKKLLASYFPSSGVQERYCSVYYDGRVYTSTIILDATDAKDALYKELGTVYGNKSHYWSCNEDDLHSADIEGTLYELTGCDKKYRVGILYEYGTEQRLMVFECLNGIMLNTGKDIFKERISLAEYFKYEIIKSDEQLKIHSGSVEESFVQEFITELCEADIRLEDDAVYSVVNNSTAYEIIFTSDKGIKERMYLYESGYAMYETAETRLYFDAAYTIRRLLAYCESGGRLKAEDFELKDVTDSKTAEKSVGYKDNGGCMLGGLLYYNGGLYSTEGMEMYTNINSVFEENIIDEALGKVYGYHMIYWSDEKEALFDCDLTATVYSIRGYDKEERVGIIYEAYGITGLMVFQRK